MLPWTDSNNEEAVLFQITGSKGAGESQGWLSQGSKIRSELGYFPFLCSAIMGWLSSGLVVTGNHNRTQQYLQEEQPLSCFPREQGKLSLRGLCRFPTVLPWPEVGRMATVDPVTG